MISQNSQRLPQQRHISGVSNMRYLIPKKQEAEIHGRQAYLYDIFQLYFLPHETNDEYIQLIPVGCNGPNYLFIIGHTDQVISFLTKNIDKICESGIIVTTCFAEKLIAFSKTKEIYIPITEDNFCNIRPGKPYGFDFDITDAELRLYNSSGLIIDRIKEGYKLIR